MKLIIKYICVKSKISRIQQCTCVIGWPYSSLFWWWFKYVICPLVYGPQTCYTLSTFWRNIKTQCSIFFFLWHSSNWQPQIWIFQSSFAFSLKSQLCQYFITSLTFLSQAILWLTKPQGCFWWVFGMTSLLMEVKVPFIIACSLEMSRLHILFFAKVVLGRLS